MDFDIGAASKRRTRLSEFFRFFSSLYSHPVLLDGEGLLWADHVVEEQLLHPAHTDSQ
jgi:hypothetical protein